jgi:periplasmic copper chaperone A
MNRSRVRTLIALLAVAVVPLAGCGDDDDASVDTTSATTVAPGDDASDDDASDDDATPSAEVVVEGAWARTSPMMAANGAAYMELTSADGDRLVAARVDASVAAAAEVHETAMDPDSGEMAMRETDAIELPAGERVVLEPGGFHVMLLDLAEPLVPGATIEVTLVFERAGDVTVEAEVRDGGMHGEG